MSVDIKYLFAPKKIRWLLPNPASEDQLRVIRELHGDAVEIETLPPPETWELLIGLLQPVRRQQSLAYVEEEIARRLWARPMMVDFAAFETHRDPKAEVTESLTFFSLRPHGMGAIPLWRRMRDGSEDFNHKVWLDLTGR